MRAPSSTTTTTSRFLIGCFLVVQWDVFCSTNSSMVQAWNQPASRREWLVSSSSSYGASLLLTGGGLLLPQVANGSEPPQAPIAVLGANGRTGVHCVAACLSRGWPVKALTRSGSLTASSSSLVENKSDQQLLTVAACDIRDSEALRRNLHGCRAVIYAASASKQGGNAREIDHVGVVQAARACLELQVPRYIVLSSTATTRPRSLGYIFTNMSVGGIMDQKRLGEVAVQTAFRDHAATPTTTTTSSYSIVRPGGLEEAKQDAILGPSALEITQGDVLAGIISRADLGEMAVELAASSAPNLQNTALELYYKDSVVPVAGEFKSFVTNGVVPRLHGDSYAELLQEVRPNIDFYAPA